MRSSADRRPPTDERSEALAASFGAWKRDADDHAHDGAAFVEIVAPGSGAQAVTIVDTSILIDHLRGNPGALSVLDGAMAEKQDLAASVLTRVEVLNGMRNPERVTRRSAAHAAEVVRDLA